MNALLLIGLIWAVGGAAALVCRKLTPEIWWWYKWYAPTVGLIGTLAILAGSGLLE